VLADASFTAVGCSNEERTSKMSRARLPRVKGASAAFLAAYLFAAATYFVVDRARLQPFPTASPKPDTYRENGLHQCRWLESHQTAGIDNFQNIF